MPHLKIINASGSSLFVADVRGADLSGVNLHQEIPNGRETIIATFAGRGLGSYGWVDLTGATDGDEVYRIHVEQRVSTRCESVSRRSSRRAEAKSDPSRSPIAWAYMTDDGDLVYTVLLQPPARSGVRRTGALQRVGGGGATRPALGG
ncbi:hypothetical protein [Sorangium sp. So ce861]|uniref:hypothetical protein n=1 Tax=Sorangium sp. So ce861 TaxID=3133323 RepID=UPI003F6394AD